MLNIIKTIVAAATLTGTINVSTHATTTSQVTHPENQTNYDGLNKNNSDKEKQVKLPSPVVSIDVNPAIVPNSVDANSDQLPSSIKPSPVPLMTEIMPTGIKDNSTPTAADVSATDSGSNPAPAKSNDTTPKQESSQVSANVTAQTKPASQPSTNQPSHREITVKATAYTAFCDGCSGITATGLNIKAHPEARVIAVDPSVIPLGSKVYVEGFGEATAADTGGAIKGHRIDVFIPSEKAARNFGVKHLKVKILNKAS